MKESGSLKFRDLEPFLQKCYKNSSLRVLESTVTNLLPTGENYCSVMAKIEATILWPDGSKEQLDLVGKMACEFEGPLIYWPDVFAKEVFVYSELLPAYRELERHAGVPESDLIDVIPKYIGHRLSLRENGTEVDKDSVLLMENVTTRGYYTCDRKLGLDIHYAKKALSSLARFHALGIAMKQKRPDFFQKAVEKARISGVDRSRICEGFGEVLKTLRDDPSFRKYLPHIELSFEQVNSKIYVCEAVEPWNTLVHGDFWINNLMFHKDEKGVLDDVKFVDFQVCLQASPLKDLRYFVSCSLNEKSMKNHVEELLELYYEEFIRWLKRVDADAKPFTKDSFDKEVKRNTLENFPLYCLALKFFLHEVDKEYDSKILSTVFKDGNSAFKSRALSMLDAYDKMGWL